MRLFEAEQARTKELQARSAELAQSLEYQTATSEVLGSSAGRRSISNPSWKLLVEMCNPTLRWQTCGIFLRSTGNICVSLRLTALGRNS